MWTLRKPGHKEAMKLAHIRITVYTGSKTGCSFLRDSYVVMSQTENLLTMELMVMLLYKNT